MALLYLETKLPPDTSYSVSLKQAKELLTKKNVVQRRREEKHGGGGASCWAGGDWPWESSACSWRLARERKAVGKRRVFQLSR